MKKTRYELHQNSLRDAGYRAFLARLTATLTMCLGNPPLNGLDFGCGPGPVLPLMMEEMGYCMEKYYTFSSPTLLFLNAAMIL